MPLCNEVDRGSKFAPPERGADFRMVLNYERIYRIFVTVQNPFRFVVSCCAKQRIEKSFSALIRYYFVDKNDDFLSVYQTCG